MIPKLIHQTAKTAELPECCRAMRDRLVALHPDWTYKLWTDADNLAFVKAEFPDFLHVYVGLPKNIMRADVIRYLLMYRLGGLYLDTDYEMLRPFAFGDQEIVLPREHDGAADGTSVLVGNSIFASRPGHPFWRAVIDELQRRPPTAERAAKAETAGTTRRFGDPVDVLNTTGPAFITVIYQRLTREGMPLFSPESEIFQPRPPRSRRAYNAILRRGVAHGIHHCHGSWREYNTIGTAYDWLSKAAKRVLGR